MLTVTHSCVKYGVTPIVSRATPIALSADSDPDRQSDTIIVSANRRELKKEGNVMRAHGKLMLGTSSV